MDSCSGRRDGIMARDQRSFNRRTVLRASTASVGGLMAVGTASADESDEDVVYCPDCLSAYNINEIQIDKAVPPSVTGSAVEARDVQAAGRGAAGERGYDNGGNGRVPGSGRPWTR